MLSPLSLPARRSAAMEAELRRLHDQVLDLRVQVSRLEVINARQARALEESAGGSAEDAPAAPVMVSTAVNTEAIRAKEPVCDVPMIPPPCAMIDVGTCTDGTVNETRDQETQVEAHLEGFGRQADSTSAVGAEVAL